MGDTNIYFIFTVFRGTEAINLRFDMIKLHLMPNKRHLDKFLIIFSFYFENIWCRKPSGAGQKTTLKFLVRRKMRAIP